MHQGVQRRNIHDEVDGDPEHAFIADQPHLQPGGADDRRSQGNEAFRGKANVANALAGVRQNLGKYQFDLLATCQKALTVFARQGRKQPSANSSRFNGRHLDSPGIGETRQAAAGQKRAQF